VAQHRVPQCAPDRRRFDPGLDVDREARDLSVADPTLDAIDL
jgi:hypothetical protein